MKRIGRAPYNSGERIERTFFSFERESQKGLEKLRSRNTLSSSVEDINNRIDRRVYAEEKKKTKQKYTTRLIITLTIVGLTIAALLIVYFL